MPKLKKRNSKHDKFIFSVGEDVYSKLTEEEKAYIYDHPDSTEHHFGLGLMIRNRYIHGKNLNFECSQADDLSSEITAYVASLVIDDYDYDNPFYRIMYDDFSFTHLRLLYRTITGTYPDDILAKYAQLPDDYDACAEARKEVRGKILDARRFKRLCEKYEVGENRYTEFKTFVDEYNKKRWDIIPYDVAVLTSSSIDAEERKRWLGVLEMMLKQTPCLASEMPSFIFNQKDAVLMAVSAFGTSLEQFKEFNSDDEVIRAALKANGEAIQYVNEELRDEPEYIKLALACEHYRNPLKLPCMDPYRDNEEFVKIALEADGNNIEWASPRIKDDFDMAAFAIRHQKGCSAVIGNLSLRLRDTFKIALLDINEGEACISEYSERLRDSDKVAKALIRTENKWKITQMSKRIQKKYGPMSR